MYEIRTTTAFDVWLDGLVGDRALTKVLARIANMAAGNFGDCRSVGGRVLESRIHSGPGYRMYFTREGSTATVLPNRRSVTTSDRPRRLPGRDGGLSDIPTARSISGPITAAC